jgi:site-specific recombinase XerD
MLVGMAPWAADLQRWAHYLEATGLSQLTIRQYRRTVVNFLADTFLDFDEVTEDDVTAYLASYPTQGPARGQILRALRSLYGWRSRRTNTPNPVAELKPKRPKYGPATTLSEEEFTRLLVAAAWRSERRAWTILLLYATGIRLASACAVRADDVHGNLLHVRVAKGSKPYSIPLGPMGRAAVAGLLPTSNGTLIGAGDGRVWEWVSQAGRDAGLHAHPHLMRHTWATRHLELGTDVRVLQELGNWADLSQIPRYTATTDARKREAQERF